MTNKEKWNEIVRLYKIYYGQKEESIQRLWENIFPECFGYSLLKNDIDTHRTIRLGSTDRVVPDIILKKDNKDLFVTELKQYNIKLDSRFERQLFSYLKQIKCNVGILICDKIYIYDYDYTKDDTEQNMAKIPFEIDNEDGIKFVELFSKDTFDKNKIKEFINGKIEMNNHINEIKEKINVDYVLDLIRLDLAKTYSEIEIKEGLKNLNISITTNYTKDNSLETKESNIFQNFSSSIIKKNNAIEMCKRNGFSDMNRSNTTYASLNTVTQKDFPSEANISKLNIDWYLILDDWSNKTYTVIRVPAYTFKEDDFKTRDDKPKHKLVYINKNNFLENKYEKANFSKYIQKVISYK